MRTVLATAFALFVAHAAAPALAVEETVLMRCGASSGKAYWFDGKGWRDDGMSSGRIFLIGNAGGVEGDFDIYVDDAFALERGQFSYRADGASVFPAAAADGRYSFIAAHSNYTEQYTFDANRGEVIWTSHKPATFAPKVAMYYAECES